MEPNTVHSSQTGSPVQPQPAAISTLGLVICLLPVVMVCIVIFRKKYQQWILHKQVNALEKIWRKKAEQGKD
jgi:hypothetical protein